MTVPNPEGSYFASVVANGSGCPQGSWNVSISPDGQVFTATFSKYEIEIAPTTPDLIVSKECVLAIQLHSPNGLSYAITSFSYSGYTFLDQGVTARLSARYWFQGQPAPQLNSNRKDLLGPRDEGFLFKDDIKTEDVVFSPCGTTRDLNVNTRLQLQNGTTQKGGGYANIAAIDGETKIEFSVKWRTCGAGASASSGTTTTPPPASSGTTTTPPASSGTTTTPPPASSGTTTTPPTSSGSTGTRTPTTGGSVGTVTRGGTTIGGVTRR